MRSILYSFLVLCMVGADARAQTDGESERTAVRAAFLDYVEAVNERDVDRIEEHYFQGTVSNFDRRGGRLLEINSDDANSDIGALIDFDLASDQGIPILTEDLDVHVYGDSAIVTGYWVGRQLQSAKCSVHSRRTPVDVNINVDLEKRLATRASPVIQSTNRGGCRSWRSIQPY